jgi:hypothetical protein
LLLELFASAVLGFVVHPVVFGVPVSGDEVAGAVAAPEADAALAKPVLGDVMPALAVHSVSCSKCGHTQAYRP